MSNNSMSFQAALSNMRQKAQGGVSAAIMSAQRSLPPPRAQAASARSRGRAAQALFDGITEAIADLIADTATPGCELELSALVCEGLMAKVARKTNRHAA